MTNPVASLAALLREAAGNCVWSTWDRLWSSDQLAEWLLARGVQYAPRDGAPSDGTIRYPRNPEPAPLSPESVQKIRDAAAPPREPPPVEFVYDIVARGRPEGPSAPPVGYPDAERLNEVPFPLRERPAGAPPKQKVTRVELIDHRHGAPQVGRVFTAWNASVALSYQDDGRTLKVFVADRGGVGSGEGAGEA